MSLINEALKRAKHAQPANARALPSSLHLRPAEPTHPSTRGIGLVLPATLGTILIAAAISFWLLKPTPQVPETAGQPARAEASSPTPTPAPPPAIAQAPVTTHALTATNFTAATDAPKTKAPVQEPPPAPAPPKLQAILFNPARPSAIISGKTAFVGDKVGELRVAAIHLNSVTLVSASQTNLLKLN